MVNGKSDLVGCELGCSFCDMCALLVSSVASHAHVEIPHWKGKKWSVLKMTRSLIFQLSHRFFGVRKVPGCFIHVPVDLFHP